MRDRKQHILLIGPLPNSQKSSLGGATISFSYLPDYCEKHRISHSVVNTQKFSGIGKNIRNLLFVVCTSFLLLWKSGVVFINVSQNGMKFLCPLIYLLSKALGKKVVIRPFGGAFKEQYEGYSSLWKKLFQLTVFKADIFYLQTEELVSHFARLARNVKQLTTSRHPPDQTLVRKDQPFQKRFVFLGHVKKTKGIQLILDAIVQLDSSYTFDIYGTIAEPEFAFLKNGAVTNYKGILLPEQLHMTLRAYDVVVLPIGASPHRAIG